MEQIEYLNKYEKDLQLHLLLMLTSQGKLQGQLLESDDLADMWEKVAPYYLQDAVKEIADYPNVALGWAMYLGMAVARYWDEDWAYYSKMNLYEVLRDKRGFDYMDEEIRQKVLGMGGEEFTNCEKLVQNCAQQVLNKIRHENISPQSPLAFHVFVRSIKVLYKIGASVELRALGYKFEKAN